MPAKYDKSRLQIGCSTLLFAFSTYAAIATYPGFIWKCCAAYAIIAFASMFLRLGWSITLAMVGTYVGFISDARVKGGSLESQMDETVTAMVAATIGGFVIGSIVDMLKKIENDEFPKHPENTDDAHITQNDEQNKT